MITIILLLFAVLNIETSSSTPALNETVFVAGNLANPVSNGGTHSKMQNISNLTTPPTHQDTLSRSDKVGKPINNSSLQDFVALEKLVNETNRSIDKLASVDFLIGFSGVIFGGSGVLLAIIVPYLY
ncbi:MAG: hypothetical protein M3044_06455, partial [Thermoproteota archaeon]|nr:hypothetical protein [Thermoproteota archaeon]